MSVNSQREKTVSWGLVAIIIVEIVVFAIGTGNYGTALRHWAKFAFLLIAIAGPIFRYLWQRTIGRITIRENLYYQKAARLLCQ